MPQDLEKEMEAMQEQVAAEEEALLGQDINLEMLSDSERGKLAQALGKIMTQVTGEKTDIDAKEDGVLVRSIQAAAELFDMLVEADILPPEAAWDVVMFESPQGFLQVMSRVRMLADDSRALKAAKKFLQEPDKQEPDMVQQDMQAPQEVIQEDMSDDLFMKRMK